MNLRLTESLLRRRGLKVLKLYAEFGRRTLMMKEASTATVAAERPAPATLHRLGSASDCTQWSSCHSPWKRLPSAKWQLPPPCLFPSTHSPTSRCHPLTRRNRGSWRLGMVQEGWLICGHSAKIFARHWKGGNIPGSHLGTCRRWQTCSGQLHASCRAPTVPGTCPRCCRPCAPGRAAGHPGSCQSTYSCFQTWRSLQVSCSDVSGRSNSEHARQRCCVRQAWMVGVTFSALHVIAPVSVVFVAVWPHQFAAPMPAPPGPLMEELASGRRWAHRQDTSVAQPRGGGRSPVSLVPLPVVCRPICPLAFAQSLLQIRFPSPCRQASTIPALTHHALFSQP